MERSQLVPSVRAELESAQSGMALLLTVLVLLMVSAIGISALNRAGDENAIASSSRRKLTTLQAAEAGLKLISDRFQPVPGQATVSVPAPLNEPNMIVDHSGFATAVRSGTIESSVPSQITRVGQTRDSGISENGEAAASELRISGGGSGTGYRFIYRVEVVATDPGGGNVQLQSQFSVRDTTGGGLGVY